MDGKIKIRHIYKAEELKRFAKLEGKYHHMQRQTTDPYNA